MNYNILVFDPSGNIIEGSGTSGWAFYRNKDIKSVGQIRAKEYLTQTDYWRAHIELIEALRPDIVVIESFTLFKNKKDVQIGSEFETAQLIGVIKVACDSRDIIYRVQPPHIKSRYPNALLLKKGKVTQDNRKRYYAAGVPITKHILDAIRHGEFYVTFKLEKEDFYEKK